MNTYQFRDTIDSKTICVVTLWCGVGGTHVWWCGSLLCRGPGWSLRGCRGRGVAASLAATPIEGLPQQLLDGC